MGTNYYLLTGKTETVECNLGCEHEIPEQLHVGKSSFGRYFTLHSMTAPDGTELHDLKSWKKYFESLLGAKFIDEYGRDVEPQEMWNCITREDWPRCQYAEEHFTPKMIGKKVHPEEKPDFFGCYDVWGEKGFIHSCNRKLGEDGLYVIMEGDFS